MASILLGPLVAGIRGSIGGTVFSRNANGNYARNRTTPVNPQTPEQTAVRNQLAGLSSTWGTLTEQQINSWIAAATGPLGAYTNRLGEPAQYTGQQLYMALGRVVQGFGNGPLEQAPDETEFLVLSLTNSTATSTAGVLVGLGLDLLYNGGTKQPPPNQRLILSASPTVSVGTSRIKTVTLKVVQRTAADLVLGSNAANVLAEYVARYGDQGTAGRGIWWSARVADSVTGITGPSITFKTPIVDVP